MGFRLTTLYASGLIFMCFCLTEKGIYEPAPMSSMLSGMEVRALFFLGILFLHIEIHSLQYEDFLCR